MGLGWRGFFGRDWGRRSGLETKGQAGFPRKHHPRAEFSLTRQRMQQDQAGVGIFCKIDLKSGGSGGQPATGRAEQVDLLCVCMQGRVVGAVDCLNFADRQSDFFATIKEQAQRSGEILLRFFVGCSDLFRRLLQVPRGWHWRQSRGVGGQESARIDVDTESVAPCGVKFRLNSHVWHHMGTRDAGESP